jgi:hypothetical protein
MAEVPELVEVSTDPGEWTTRKKKKKKKKICGRWTMKRRVGFEDAKGASTKYDRRSDLTHRGRRAH